jgi:hypothetical protein
MDINTKRQSEIDKYVECYKVPGYQMGAGRRNHITLGLKTIPVGTLLDVGTGRGSTISM